MSTEQNKALVHRVINEWWSTNTPDPSVADELIGPDFIAMGCQAKLPVPKVSGKSCEKCGRG